MSKAVKSDFVIEYRKQYIEWERAAAQAIMSTYLRDLRDLVIAQSERALRMSIECGVEVPKVPQFHERRAKFRATDRRGSL